LLVPVPVPTLLISGTVAAGKSTVAAELNDTLAALKIPNAAVDLDALVWQWPSSSQWNSDLMFENLAVLWPNYQARGVAHLVLACVLEDAADLDRYRAAVPGAQITVCRLAAQQATRIDRLRRRMPPGPRLDWHLARTGELDGILERRAHEDFVVENGLRPPREVAIEILLRAGWISNRQAAEAARAG
jgi:adenylylsulfate kinase